MFAAQRHVVLAAQSTLSFQLRRVRYGLRVVWVVGAGVLVVMDDRCPVGAASETVGTGAACAVGCTGVVVANLHTQVPPQRLATISLGSTRAVTVGLRAGGVSLPCSWVTVRHSSIVTRCAVAVIARLSGAGCVASGLRSDNATAEVPSLLWREVVVRPERFIIRPTRRTRIAARLWWVRALGRSQLLRRGLLRAVPRAGLVEPTEVHVTQRVPVGAVAVQVESACDADRVTLQIPSEFRRVVPKPVAVQAGGRVVVVPGEAERLMEVRADVHFALAVRMHGGFPDHLAVVVFDPLGAAPVVREVVVA